MQIVNCTGCGKLTTQSGALCVSCSPADAIAKWVKAREKRAEAANQRDETWKEASKQREKTDTKRQQPGPAAKRRAEAESKRRTTQEAQRRAEAKRRAEAEATRRARQERSESSSMKAKVECPQCRTEMYLRDPLSERTFHCRPCGCSFRASLALEIVRKPESPEAHRVLGTKPEFSDEEVKRHWREKLRKYHPDKVEALGDEFKVLAEEKTKALNFAYGQIKRDRGIQ